MSENNRFFEPIEFKEPIDPSSNKPKEIVIWDKEQLKQAWEEIQKGIEQIKRGTFPGISVALDPGRFSWPAANAVKNFMEEPNDRNFKGIREILRQDFKASGGEKFYRLLLKCRRVEKNEEANHDDS
jgi:hypothetical protein